MFDKQIRFKKDSLTCLGPDTYSDCVTDIYCKRRACEPFWQSACKNTFIPLPQVDAIYDTRRSQHIKGGVMAKAKRKIGGDSIPDKRPLYDLKFVSCKKKRQLDPCKPKRYICRVDYTIFKSGPSVPSKKQKNGYDIDFKGFIQPITYDPEPYHCYDYAERTMFAAERFHGWRWSKSKTQRFKNLKDTGPGPGYYDPKLKKEEDEEGIRFRDLATRFSFVPRYIMAQQMKTMKECLPAPNEYDIRTCKLCQIAPKIAKDRPCHGVTCPKPKFEKDTTGPPHAYGIKDDFKKHCSHSIKGNKFAVGGAERFSNAVSTGPEPGTYNLRSIFKCPCTYADYHVAPFLCSAERKVNESKKGCEFEPGPEYYPVDPLELDVCYKDKKVKTLSPMFKQGPQRFPDKCKEDLSPATYHTTCAFKALNDQCYHNVQEIPFNSYAVRLGGFETPVPAPNEYQHEPCTPAKGAKFTEAERWSKDDQNIPGPGQYDIPKSTLAMNYALTSHNIKLQRNIDKKLRIRTEDAKDWYKKIKKRKRLKWVQSGHDMEIWNRYDELIKKVIYHTDSRHEC